MRHSPGREIGPAFQLLRCPSVGLPLMAHRARVRNFVLVRHRGRNEAESMRVHFDVRNGGLDFRHVATSAASLADLAQFRFGTRTPRMASPAAIVIADQRLHCVGMRIVTSCATDARIRRVVTLAVRQPVRLKAHV